MKEISFSDARARFPERFAVRPRASERTHADVYREYNDEKYAALTKVGTFDEALRRYRGSDSESICSRHEHLFVAQTNAALAFREQCILEALAPLLTQVDTVVELGAGFGQTLEIIRRVHPTLRYIAGEFSPEARALGSRVAPEITFVPFDFYDEHWDIFDSVQRALVLSFHAIEMVPDAHPVAKKIHAAAGVQAFSLFEPIHEPGDTPLRALRQDYIEAHDYCENTLSAFEALCNNLTVERDFFGGNPLFPEANLVWSGNESISA